MPIPKEGAYLETDFLDHGSEKWGEGTSLQDSESLAFQILYQEVLLLYSPEQLWPGRTVC